MPVFLYRLALACWVGGAALFTFILTPALFTSFDRDLAGRIVGVLFPGYFKWGLVCGTVALVAMLVMSAARHRTTAVILIVLMLAVTAVQAFVIEPKAAEIKKNIASFETTPKDDPYRQQFSKLHAVSAVSNLAVIGGGVVLIFLL